MLHADFAALFLLDRCGSQDGFLLADLRIFLWKILNNDVIMELVCFRHKSYGQVGWNL